MEGVNLHDACTVHMHVAYLAVQPSIMLGYTMDGTSLALKSIV